MISITENAKKEIKKILEEQNLSAENTYLRVKVVGGGCSGFSLKLDLDEEITDKDQFFDINDVKVVIDKRSLIYLEGAEVDYLNALNSRGFKVNIKNVKSTCGCGSSFSI